MRWSVFLRPAYRAAGIKPISWWSLIGSQFVGFTGLNIFGRIGELIPPSACFAANTRPQLQLADRRRQPSSESSTSEPSASFFSLNLAFSSSLNALPHHELFHKVGYALAALSVIVALFVLAIRVSGEFRCFRRRPPRWSHLQACRGIIRRETSRLP